MSTVSCPPVAFNLPTDMPSDAAEGLDWYEAQRAVESADDSHRADLHAAIARILSVIPNAKPKVGREIQVDCSFTLYPTTRVSWYVILYGLSDKGIFASAETVDDAVDAALAKVQEGR